MSKSEAAVREAAVKLHAAIVEARTEGLHVEWPRNPDGLPGIAISATKKAAPQPDEAKPARGK